MCEVLVMKKGTKQIRSTYIPGDEVIGGIGKDQQIVQSAKIDDKLLLCN
jgi:hypothetical protein